MLAHLLNVREAAACLGVHENTIRNWEARGILRAIHLPVSGYRRFETSEIERMSREMLLAPCKGRQRSRHRTQRAGQGR